MYLIPTPQKVTEKNELLKKHTIKLSNELSDSRLLKAVNKLSLDNDGIPLFITYKDTNEEGYRLYVSNEEIKIEGDGINGAFYAIQTLCQIFENDEICCVEIEDKPKYVFWFERQEHHTIDIENPESIEFIKSIIKQFSSNFSSDYIHICGDEPFDLIRFGNRESRGIDVHKMYAEYLLEIIEYVKSLGKKVMLWGGSFKRERADLQSLIPEDALVCNHGYAMEPPEERFMKYEGQNFRTVVCPSTSTYYRLVENTYVSEKNIRNISVYGRKYGSIGMINTNWGDYGNPCCLELAMFGMVAGAQMSWDFENTLDDNFKKAVNCLLYKNEKGYEYVYKTDRIHDKANYWQLVRYYSNCILPGREIRWTQYPSVEDVREAAKESKELFDELSAQKWEKDEYRTELMSALYGTGVIAELFERHMTGTKSDRWTDTEKWLKTFRELWVSKNKESELFRIEEFFRGVEELPPQNKIFTYYGPEMD